MQGTLLSNTLVTHMLSWLSYAEQAFSSLWRPSVDNCVAVHGETSLKQR